MTGAEFLGVIARARPRRSALGDKGNDVPVCHREERSDVAIHLKFQLDCRARQAGLAMTKKWSGARLP